MPHKRRGQAALNAVTAEQLASAQDEAQRQIHQRDASALRLNRLRDLEMLEPLFKDRDHPAWWALAFAVLRLHPAKQGAGLWEAVEREGLWEAVQLVIEHLAERMGEAIVSARVLIAAPALWSETSARDGESLLQATERILLERGASSYAIVRALEEHAPNMHSTGLPQDSVRRVRRKAVTLRKEAEAKRDELARVSIARPPATADSLENVVIDGLFAWFENQRSTAEKRQAAIVANLDRPQRRTRPRKPRRS